MMFEIPIKITAYDGRWCESDEHKVRADGTCAACVEADRARYRKRALKERAARDRMLALKNRTGS